MKEEKEEKEELIPYNWTTLPTGKYKNEWKIPDKKDMQEIEFTNCLNSLNPNY